MKRSFLQALVICALAIVLTAGGVLPVVAQTATSARAPAETSPGYVALLFYRLTGQQPDFDAWAMASDDYSRANGFDKDLVRREKAAEVTRAYHLITYDDPVVVQRPVLLSSYSRSKRGFFVQSFRPDTFFGFDFLGRDYALVPIDLMDFQWVSLETEEDMRRIDAHLRQHEGKAIAYISVVPVSADRERPMPLDGRDYWLLSGRIKRLQLFDATGQHLLWEGVGKEESARHRQQVMDLYR